MSRDKVKEMQMIRRILMVLAVFSMAFNVACAGGEKKADEAPTEEAPMEEPAPATAEEPPPEIPVEEPTDFAEEPSEELPEEAAEGGDTAE